MSQYSQNDIKEFNDVFKKRMEEVKKKQLVELEPYGDEKLAVTKIIHDFIKKKKRKVYGGFAHNLLISDKNPSDAFYDDNDFPDMDFYSPDPITDIIEISNELHDKNFSPIVGQEAQHEGTYKLFVNYDEYCDISYVPRNIYNKMPFNVVKGYTVVQPILAYIDYLRMFNDPMTSWEIKLEKRFPRYTTLLKYYPLPQISKPINIKIPSDKTLDTILESINDYLIDNATLISIGLNAYNYFRHKNNQNTIQTPYYEIISTSFRHDALELINRLKKISDKIKTEEHYHFFQFFGNSVYIYYDDHLVSILYTTNGKCIPYNSVHALYFLTNKVEKKTGLINIGSFSLVIQYALSGILQARTNDDRKTSDIYYNMISHMNDSKNSYIKKHNKNAFDSDIYSDFITKCKGATISAKREGLLRAAKKFQKRKPVWRYKPAEKKLTKAPETMRFFNSSGNPINNEKNFYLGEKDIIDSETDTDSDSDSEIDTDAINIINE